jgi:hypothetical protein
MPKGKTAKSLALINACYDILQEIHPATVRAVCYQLFIRQLLPSMAKTHTNRVSAQLVYARKAGIISWEWIVDETRAMEYAGTWKDPETFASIIMDIYRRDRWALQPHRVEVWSEKGTVRGTLGQMLKDFGIHFMPAHGFTSWTQSHDAAEACRRDPRPFTILYVGDHDPSGRHMSDVDLPENRFLWEGIEVEIRRLALDPTDPAQRALPAFPAADKQTDTRYTWFREVHGDTCWEVDAMNPNNLRTLVQRAIEGYIDWDAWFRCEQVEQAEQRSLREILSQWPKAMSGQASI